MKAASCAETSADLQSIRCHVPGASNTRRHCVKTPKSHKAKLDRQSTRLAQGAKPYPAEEMTDGGIVKR